VRTRIEQFAVVSGGRAIFPRIIEDLLPLYDQIHRDLGSGYQITYSPERAGDGKPRQIEVRLKSNPGFALNQSYSAYLAR
jgi:hypothetical protein